MRDILFYDSVNDYSVPTFLSQLSEARSASEGVNINANSGGGSVVSGIGMITAYADYPYEKQINVHGGAGSFMAFLLLWSDKVTATNMSQFLWHRAAPTYGAENAAKMAADINDKIRAKFESVVNIEGF